MALVGKKDALFLLILDMLSFVVALWLALFLRYIKVPAWELYYNNLDVFLPVFVSWLLAFFIFGLYDRYTTAFKIKLPDTILNVSIFNGIIALFFFYLFPDSNITPKTNLLLCLILSTIFIYFWRVYFFDFIRSSRTGNIMLAGSGLEIDKIGEEIEKNKIYGMKPILVKTLDENIFKNIKEHKIKNLIVSLRSCGGSKNLQLIYEIICSGVNVIDVEEVYESLFDKVSLSYVNEDWFVFNKPEQPKIFYDIVKRLFDLIVSLILAPISLILYPFVYLAIKIEDGGPALFAQERVGRNGHPIKIVKFRSMSVVDEGKWVVKNDPRITRVGNFLRKSRIDELPQLWNVIWGDISLIGPRPEIPHLVKLYEKEIPYYNMRHLVQPGLSGWAQIHHDKPPHSIEETREKLSYDLYYIKNRSLMLELEIALKTIKTLLMRLGV